MYIQQYVEHLTQRCVSLFVDGYAANALLGCGLALVSNAPVSPGVWLEHWPSCQLRGCTLSGTYTLSRTDAIAVGVATAVRLFVGAHPTR